jgi:hypothetical protein
MALLLLRHALSISDNEGNDDDASTMFSVSLVFSLYLSLPIVLLVPCVDLNHCSCFCCELLDFCCRAISWLGSSVFCTADDRGWYVISSSEWSYVVHEQNYISYRYFYGHKITKYAIRVERLVLHAPEFLVHRTMSCISHTASVTASLLAGRGCNGSSRGDLHPRINTRTAHQFAIAPDSPATPQHELSPQ